MIFKATREDDNVINVSAAKRSKLSQDAIHDTLDVGDRVTMTHDCTIKGFLPSMAANSKLMLIVFSYPPLEEERSTVNS